MPTIEINIVGPSESRWSIDAGVTWHASGDQILVSAGTYNITFNAVAAYNSPLPLSGILLSDLDNYIRETYFTEIEQAGIYGHDSLNEFCAQRNILPPSFETNIVSSLDVLTASFGDGYAQRALNGLHSKAIKGAVVWTELKLDKIKELEKYFSSRNGVKSFSWIPPRYEHQLAKRFVTNEWNRGYVGYTHDNFQIQIKQVFDIT